MNIVEGDPRNIPIHFEFGPHEPTHGNLEPLKVKLHEILSGDSEGKVLFLMEEGNGNEIHSLITLKLARVGFSPSQAYYGAAVSPKRFFKNPSRETEKAKRKTNSNDAKFINQELEILDEAAKDYPGRVLLLTEWITGESRSIGNRFEQEYSRSFQLTSEGRVNEALLSYKKAVDSSIESSRLRETFVLNSINLAASDPEIVAVVGHYGQAHSNMYKDLKKDGYSVTRSFTTSDNGSSFLDPSAVMEMAVRYAPDREISEEEWLTSLVGECYYRLSLRFLDFQLEKGHIPDLTLDSYQKVLRDTFKFMSRTRPRIDELKRLIEEKGFLDAILSFPDEDSTLKT